MTQRERISTELNRRPHGIHALSYRCDERCDRPAYIAGQLVDARMSPRDAGSFYLNHKRTAEAAVTVLDILCIRSSRA